MSLNEVGYTKGLTLKIHRNTNKKRETIAGPRIQRDYMKIFNDVDNNNHGRYFYSTAIRKIYYYLRILCWALDRVVHTLFVVVRYLSISGIGKSEWKKYLNRNNFHHDFQIDLSISLINFEIALKWGGKSKHPGWMRQSEFVPYDSGMCYF